MRWHDHTIVDKVTIALLRDENFGNKRSLVKSERGDRRFRHAHVIKSWAHTHERVLDGLR